MNFMDGMANHQPPSGHELCRTSVLDIMDPFIASSHVQKPSPQERTHDGLGGMSAPCPT